MEELKEKLLSRIDFSILITITIALGSIWRLANTVSMFIGILVGAYFLMGLFLCFIKCKELFSEKDIYKKLSENTAYTFFHSWFYVLIIYFFSYTTQSYLPEGCWIIFCFCLTIVYIYIMHKKKSIYNSVYRILIVFTIWYMLSLIITLLLSLNISIEHDKEFYNYDDKVYITLETTSEFNNEVEAIFLDHNGVEIAEVTVLKGNTYAIPAAELYCKEVYAVYTFPVKLNKEKLLSEPDISKIARRARIEKLSLKIRMPEE